MKVIKDRRHDTNWIYDCTHRATLYNYIKITNLGQWRIYVAASYTNNNLLYYHYQII